MRLNEYLLPYVCAISKTENNTTNLTHGPRLGGIGNLCTFPGNRKSEGHVHWPLGISPIPPGNLTVMGDILQKNIWLSLRFVLLMLLTTRYLNHDYTIIQKYGYGCSERFHSKRNYALDKSCGIRTRFLTPSSDALLESAMKRSLLIRKRDGTRCMDKGVFLNPGWASFPTRHSKRGLSSSSHTHRTHFTESRKID